MTSQNSERVTAEAYRMLEELLVRRYGEPYEAGYRVLARKLAAVFRAKQINFKYLPVLSGKVEDLVEEVFSRLARINVKSVEETGEMIRDPEPMSFKIAELVYLEEWRKMEARLADQPIDGDGRGGRPLPLAQPADAEAESILNEIMQECYDACVERLPDEARKVFMSYYPDVRLDPQELKARRRRLAKEYAGMAQTQTLTPDEEEQLMNNLRVKVNKLKKREVEGCVTGCTEDKSSRHVRLNALGAQ